MPEDISPSAARPQPAAREITLFLCGDVMTGRGIDQILAHPGAPEIFEPYVHSAAGYVELAERASGGIVRPVDMGYIWGDALAELARVQPQARIVNLETAVTASDDAARDKHINYRMHPANSGCLTAAGIDCCVLANNHVLDWGRRGLLETLDTLHGAGMRTAGAGRDRGEAAAPAVIGLPDAGRVLVFAFGLESSGVPPQWAAGERWPGVNYLGDLSARAVDGIARQVAAARRAGDVVVASIHWGPNWGYGIPQRQREFAHGLIDDAGVDIVHGHSSHHPKAVEIYRDKPVLYGCGDFLNDYEGIGGYEEYRGDLALMYFPTVDAATGTLSRLVMTPTRIRRLRVNRAPAEGARWLADMLDREGRQFGTRVERRPDGTLALQWG